MSTTNSSQSLGATPAVIYAAKSTQDRKASIPEQLSDCREMAREHGWEIVAEFSDEGFSAYSGNRGPGLEQAKQTAAAAAERSGRPAILIAQAHDRFARGAGDRPGAPQSLGEIWHEMRRRNVWLRTVEDDEELRDEASVAAIGRRAHIDSARKSKSVRKGLARRARERGMPTGGPRPYGYRLVGPPTEMRLEVVPSEAAVIRRMFDEALGGKSQMQIARSLNRDGIRTATGKEWLQATVRRILANELYAGKVRHAGETYAGAHEAIVDEKTWLAAKAIRDTAGEAKGHRGGRLPKGQHLLVKGIFRCRCGSAMIPRSYRSGSEVYYCDGRWRHGTGFCDQAPIRRERVDVPLWENLTSRWLGVNEAKARLRERLESERALAEEALSNARRDLLRAEERFLRVRGDYQDGVISGPDWAEQRPGLLEGREAARKAVRTAESALERDPSPDLEARVLQHLDDIRGLALDRLDGIVDLDDARRFLRELLSVVELEASGKSILPVLDGTALGITPERLEADYEALVRSGRLEAEVRAGRIETESETLVRASAATK